ncbi:hypothetical protein FNL56_06125 [Tardiphaga sp. vice304]|nr:hypothetical protein FNL56_06125 [Tardiphaga sp. vice304]
MKSKFDSLGYHIVVIRVSKFPVSWRWRIVRRGAPMGVNLEAEGFSDYLMARLAGNRALGEFLEELMTERLRFPSE